MWCKLCFFYFLSVILWFRNGFSNENSDFSNENSDFLFKIPWFISNEHYPNRNHWKFRFMWILFLDHTAPLRLRIIHKSPDSCVSDNVDMVLKNHMKKYYFLKKLERFASPQSQEPRFGNQKKTFLYNIYAVSLEHPASWDPSVSFAP